MNESDPLPTNYAVVQRLRLIDCLLDRQGHVGRAVLVDYFGIGEATATRDFAAYIEIAPGNLVLNQADKLYYRTLGFKRVWP